MPDRADTPAVAAERSHTTPAARKPRVCPAHAGPARPCYHCRRALPSRGGGRNPAGRAKLHRLHRALRPGGLLYLTVEEIDDAAIRQAFHRARDEGLPVVHGEVVEEDVAG